MASLCARGSSALMNGGGGGCYVVFAPHCICTAGPQMADNASNLHSLINAMVEAVHKLPCNVFITAFQMVLEGKGLVLGAFFSHNDGLEFTKAAIRHDSQTGGELSSLVKR